MNPKGFFVISTSECEHYALLLWADDVMFCVWQITVKNVFRYKRSSAKSQTYTITTAA